MGHKPWDREAKRAEKAERKRQWKADIEALGELQVAEDENEARDDG
jgi:hypothetical protein